MGNETPVRVCLRAARRRLRPRRSARPVRARPAVLSFQLSYFRIVPRLRASHWPALQSAPRPDWPRDWLQAGLAGAATNIVKKSPSVVTDSGLRPLGPAWLGCSPSVAGEPATSETSRRSGARPLDGITGSLKTSEGRQPLFKISRQRGGRARSLTGRRFRRLCNARGSLEPEFRLFGHLADWSGLETSRPVTGRWHCTRTRHSRRPKSPNTVLSNCGSAVRQVK